MQLHVPSPTVERMTEAWRMQDGMSFTGGIALNESISVSQWQPIAA